MNEYEKSEYLRLMGFEPKKENEIPECFKEIFGNFDKPVGKED